jgi:hypothetical protein
MRTWLPFLIFVLAIVSPIVVGAYVIFGVSFDAANNFAQQASSPLAIVLSIILGISISIVIGSFFASLRLRFKKQPYVEVVEHHPSMESLHSDQYVSPSEDTIYIAQPTYK